MAVNQSFVGQVVNPVVQARLQMAMNSNALARRLGLSRQYISRAEQGTYSSLNPTLLKWTSDALAIDRRWVEKSYANFQSSQRRATVEKIAPVRLERADGDMSPGGYLFEKWRSSYWYSVNAFAVDFCVHPNLVTKYEEGDQDNMPKQIKAALEETNLIALPWVESF